jgi:hypothetical protein
MRGEEISKISTTEDFNARGIEIRKYSLISN